MSAIERIKKSVAEKLMLHRGYKHGESLIEWDLSNPDSQHAMIYEDVDFIIDQALEEIQTITDDDDDYEEDEEEFEPQVHKTVTRSSATFIFMDAGIGNPTYVGDVREWLRSVDTAGIPDSTEVEGTLHLSYDYDLENIERIECMECGEKDLLLTTHKCETHA